MDTDDALSEATLLGAISTAATTVNSSLTPDVDVDMYRFTVTAGQVVDFDIDTALNGPGGLGSYLRLFNGQGQQLASNNDAVAPGENVVGFDAYLRYTFSHGGHLLPRCVECEQQAVQLRSPAMGIRRADCTRWVIIS